MSKYEVVILLLVVGKSSCFTVKSAKSIEAYAFPFIERSDWGARPSTYTTKLVTPVPYVVIHHTYRPEVCLSFDACGAAMRSMQDTHQVDNGWADIGYNFAVGGEGSVYEGRGWKSVGAHAVGYNSRAIGIALIGDWVSKTPSPAQLNAAKLLIEAGVKLGHIAPDYSLIGHRQAGSTECPGDALFNEISTWPNFRSG